MAPAVDNLAFGSTANPAAESALAQTVWSVPLRGRRFRATPSQHGSAAPVVQDWVSAGNWTIPCFVAGAENRLVAATAAQLIDAVSTTEPCPIASPIVLIGPNGCGKTHLARGIAEVWHAALGDSEVAYLTASDFCRQVATSIADRSVNDLRKQLRRVKLLVIEDLPRLAGEAFAVKELTHTLDALEESGGMFIGTCSTPLAEAPHLSRGLIGRLLRGVTLRIAPLGIPARQALMRQALLALGLQCNDDALKNLAQHAPDDPQRLFAEAIELRQKLRAGVVIDAPLAETLLRSGDTKPSPPTDDIVTIVAKYYGLTRAALTSSSRKQTTVLARAVAIYLIREMTPLSYDQIGRLLGGRDHTTVLHNFRRIDRAAGTDRALTEALAELRRSILP